jgi:NAD(P)H-dependent flavin oxidoreductase YrpB (nitropropane dioxygenase family)
MRSNVFSSESDSSTAEQNRSVTVPIRFKPKEWVELQAEARSLNIPASTLVWKRAVRKRVNRMRVEPQKLELLRQATDLTNACAGIWHELVGRRGATENKLERAVITRLKERIEAIAEAAKVLVPAP